MPAIKTKAVAVGDKAPNFSAADETGRTWSLKALKGKTIVLYFYPKDNTSGCTTEACDFRDYYDSFVKKGARIFGVSPDAAKSHAGFKAKHGLPFPLLIDEDKSLCRAYGVWREKTLYGRKFMGVVRSTFVIGKDGRVVQAVRKVSVAGHAKAILETV
ncbi:MAG: peroxiredoxin [Elusimicrobia bacterium CG11_big_fil_rev_8_21_14_0_20_64_6]|nr:MAG: peroxiredoxin [Elusimicrobia bacterium CG11_big_fil_rev_8_21_14_0_20_64_6]